MHLLNRLINLARVFLEGRGLPFLGAGVSMGARTSQYHDLEPTVTWMIEQVIERCSSALLDDVNRQRQLFAMLGMQGDVDLTSSISLKNTLRECVNYRMGKLCEALNTLGLLSHRDIVVKAMRIHQFAKLEPTEAHRYIACLARESLVNEVITTNYDCCMEKAVLQAAGQEGNGAPSPDGNVKPAISIATFENYRRYSARRFDLGKRVAILRVYKINGCAGSLAELICRAPEKNPENNILLTEQQLQHIDDRTWARDLIKDRFRSRAFVFSGFGSDEPQVRFTMLRLLEEFNENGSAGDLANSIWLHLYDRELSFPQRQIMHGFWETGEQVDDHRFSAKDCETLKSLGSDLADCSGNGLTADTFWMLLFCVVFLAIQEQQRRDNISDDFFATLEEPYRQQARSMFIDWCDPVRIGAAVLDDDFLDI